MNKLIVPLTQIKKKDISIAGGKGSNLGELIKHKFPVPNGFIISTEAYKLFLEYNQISEIIHESLNQIDYSDPNSIVRTSQIIQENILTSQIPDELIQLINNNYSNLELSSVAVRSSATAEDLPDASFAGQQDTYLNIKGIDELVKSIVKCYASLWSSRTISYRNKNRIPQENVEIAVVVQSMISARSAGVMFTVNPISINRNEVLIESTFGLGESLVSGETTPDQFTILKKKKKFKIISRKIGQKLIITKESEQGIQQVDLTEENSKKSSLNDDQIVRLAQIGKKIESKFKNPQDIEWAIDNNGIIHILQSRPITSLPTRSKDTETIWSRGWADDYWNDPTTPLFFDLLGSQLTWITFVELSDIMGYPAINEEVLKLTHGHAYFSLGVIKRRVEYEIPSFLRNENFLNYFPEGEGPYGKTTIRNLPFRLFRRIVAEIRVMMHDSANGSITKTANSYEEWTLNTFNPFCKEFDSKLEKYRQSGSIQELLSLSDDLENLMIAHYRMVRYGIAVHCIGMNLAVEYLLSQFVGKILATQVYPILISGLKHKASEINNEIHKLAKIIQSNSELREIILKTDSINIYGILSNNKDNETIQEFLKELNRFLLIYGDRGFSREIYYQRWKEAPQLVFDLLKPLIFDESKDLSEIEIKNSLLRSKSEKLVEAKIRKTRLGLVKFKLYSIILNFARRYIIFRENQRFNLDRWITRNRNLYLEIGKRLHKQNILNKPSEVFFLHKNEIRKISSGQISTENSQDLLKIVEERIQEFKKYEFITPPKFIQGTRAYNDPAVDSRGQTRFQGIAASQGMVTGEVRVLTDINGISQVRTGDILVVPKTDPGWTPVFSKIGGLITETGGILSHGAVVAREYSVPAVTNIVDACKIFKNRMKVSLDGNTGTIFIQDE